MAILAKGVEPVERLRGLPGDPADEQSRYLEAEAHGLVVGCLYLPNGNPQPGPKFDYKLAWFERLIEHARKLYAGGQGRRARGRLQRGAHRLRHLRPAAPGARTRCCSRRAASATGACSSRAGPTRCAHATPRARIYTFWDYFRQHWEHDAGLRIDHLLLDAALGKRLVDAGVDKWVRGLAKASDHAPTWVTLER